MGVRYIDNITILARVNESISLPPFVMARNDDDTFSTVPITWSPSTVDTSVAGEFIFEGTVNGYVYKVLCSVQVGEAKDNPESLFPERIDQFGLPKKDIQTADIPDIDDYQYFKAKVPRNKVEEYQLKQLKEMLADKIVLARDVNHMRNAILALEEYALDLQDQIRALETRVENLEERVETLELKVSDIEDDMVIDGKNIGSGARIFESKVNKKLEMRSLRGRGLAEVYEQGREVIIDVGEPDIPEPTPETGCGSLVEAKRFEVCDSNMDFRTAMADGVLKFSDFFGMKMVKVKNRKDSGGAPFNSMLWVMGSGENVSNMKYAGRMLKGTQNFIMEIKVEAGQYVGIELSNNGGEFYKESYSKIDDEIYGGGSVYTASGARID